MENQSSINHRGVYINTAHTLHTHKKSIQPMDITRHNILHLPNQATHAVMLWGHLPLTHICNINTKCFTVKAQLKDKCSLLKRCFLKSKVKSTEFQETAFSWKKKVLQLKWRKYNLTSSTTISQLHSLMCWWHYLINIFQLETQSHYMCVKGNFHILINKHHKCGKV